MAPSLPTKSIAVTSAAEKKEYAATEAYDSVFVNCHLVPPSCSENERKPIDVVVVLDRSGSMAGEKLALCKKTLDFLAQQLTANDRVGLVSYDSGVTTDVHLIKMTDNGKAQLAAKVRALTDGSSTNLSGGLEQGIKEIRRRPWLPFLSDSKPNPVQAILLLTDGQANEGVTDIVGLSKIVEGKLPRHVSLHTFGYGSDHDASLLTKLSDLGRGSYYFVKDVDAVMLAFADCLGGLLSVVAQNIHVTCTVETKGVVLKSVKTKRPTRVENSTAHVEMGDMYAEETRDLLVELALPLADASSTAPVVEIAFHVRYANILSSSMEAAVTTVTMARPATVTNDDVDAYVVEQKQRIMAVEAMEAAQAAANMGNYDQGQELLASAMSRIARMCREVEGEVVNQHAIISDLEACQATMSSAAAYRSTGHAMMQQKTQLHYAQRANNIEMNEAELDDNEDAPSSGYQHKNQAKRAMIKRAFASKKTSFYSSPN